jgi:imidazolonepropionase-like amidohydrolase
VVLQSTFEFADRGVKVPISATLRLSADLRPESFLIRGKTSRFSEIDRELHITGRTATVREQEQTRQVTAPDRFFTIGGYAPVSVQMLLVRYLRGHRGLTSIPILPSGEVRLERRGVDTIELGGSRSSLERYSVSGVIWGRESLWVDSKGDLAALVGLDTEFDHFEAIRPEYAAALPVFVTKAAEDGMAVLGGTAQKFSAHTRGLVAITGATVIDGTESHPIRDAIIVIDGGRIRAVGTRNQVTLPAGARIIDASGKFVLPGLWDMHAHFEQVEWGPIYLAAGVTTVRDVGNELEFVTAVRSAIDTRRGIGPRMLLAGIVDGNSPSAIGIIRAETPEQAREVVLRYRPAGFEQIKIYTSVKLDMLRVIAAEAHAEGMTVTGHIPRGLTVAQALEAGQDQINHVDSLRRMLMPSETSPLPLDTFPPPLDAESETFRQAITRLKQHNTVIDPTLALFEFIYRAREIPAERVEPAVERVAPELVQALRSGGVPPAVAAQRRAWFEQYVSLVEALHRAGLRIVAGTDQVVPGHSLHREIELYVRAGFTPLAAIQAATIVPARVMGLSSEVGTLEAGKRADLIIVDGNPLQDIRHTRNIHVVMANGRVFEPAPLWRSVGFAP